MPKTQNYGLAGGQLDASKHIALASDPAAYMRRMGERPWMTSYNRDGAMKYLADQSSN